MTHDANSSRPHFLAPLFKPDGEQHVLRNQRTGGVVVRRLEVAFDSSARRRGLLGRPALASDAALVIAPCSSVHTFFMQFTIDVAFVNRRGTVLKCYRGLRPWRIAFAVNAFAVLEFAEGAIDRSGMVTGDQLAVVADSERC